MDSRVVGVDQVELWRSLMDSRAGGLDQGVAQTTQG